MEERDFIETYLREELRLANRYAPRERLSICNLMKMEVPFVHTLDGGIHMVDPRELNLLYETVQGDCSLKLPILIEYVPEGEGIYVVKEEVSVKALTRILDLKSYSKPLVLYRSQVLELRRILRTTTVILLSPRVLRIDSGGFNSEQ